VRVRLVGHKDILSGLVFFLAGLAFFVLAQGYEIGTAFAMGPGYYPAFCGILLMVLGAASVGKGILTTERQVISWDSVGPLMLIMASIVSFGLLVERAGLVVATLVSLIFACLGRLRSRPLEIVAIFAVLTTFNILVFVYAFGMTMPLFWWSR
jgi:hypothetical protein